MKIIPQRRIGPLRHARFDVSGPLRVADAEASASAKISGAISDVGTLYAKYEQNKIDDRDKIEEQDANLKVSEKVRAWESDHKDRVDYGPGEVHPDIETNRDRDRIPRFEVGPQMYDQYMGSSLSDASTGITDVVKREAWLKDKKIILNGQVGKQHKAAGKEARAYRLKIGQAQIEAAMEGNRFSEARLLIKNMPLNDDQKKVLSAGVNIEQENYRYRTTLLSTDPVRVKADIDILESEEYRKSTVLSDEDHVARVSQLRTHLNSLLDDKSARAGWAKARVKQDMSSLITSLKNGGTYDPGVYNKVIARAYALDVDPRLLQRAIGHEAAVSELLLIPASAREANIRAHSDREKTSLERGLLYDRLVKAHEDAIKEQDDDPVGYAQRRLNMDIPPLPSPADEGFVEALETRIDTKGTIFERTGRQSAYFANAEAKQLTDQLDSAPIGQKTIFIEKMQAAFGEDVGEALEELGMKKPAGWIYAGETEMNIARDILTGSDMRKLEPLDDKSSVEGVIHGMISQAYGKNFRRYGHVKEAVKDYYSFLMNGKGLKDYDEKVLELAVETVTGGLIEYSGVQIEPPERNMTEDKFEDWTDALHPDYIDTLGGVSNMSSSEFVAMMRDDRFYLENVGKGEYLVLHKDSKAPVFTEGNKPFILKYDPEAPYLLQSEGLGTGVKVQIK